MNLEVSISQRTAEWLEEKAKAAGTDGAVLAARELEQLAEQDLDGNGRTAEQSHRDWVREFDRWASCLPRCGGKANPSRETIYD